MDVPGVPWRAVVFGCTRGRVASTREHPKTMAETQALLFNDEAGGWHNRGTKGPPCAAQTC